MSDELFVPEDFAVPREASNRGIPAGPARARSTNEADYAAWDGPGIDHIRGTPGFL